MDSFTQDGLSEMMNKLIVPDPNMDPLEYKVREAMVVKKSEELYQTMQRPEKKEELKGALGRICRKVVSPLMSVLPEGELPFNNDMMMMMMESSLQQAFSNKDYLSTMYRFQYMMPDEKKEEMFRQLREETVTDDGTADGMDENRDVLKRELSKEDSEIVDGIVGELRKKQGDIYVSPISSDKIVFRLVEIAREEGLEEAVKDESEYRVTRELCPTAEEYIAYNLLSMETAKRQLSNLKDAFAPAGEIEDSALGGIFATMRNFFTELHTIMQDVNLGQTYENTRKIYGRCPVVISGNDASANDSERTRQITEELIDRCVREASRGKGPKYSA